MQADCPAQVGAPVESFSLANEVMESRADNLTQRLQFPSQHLSSLECLDLSIMFFSPIYLFDRGGKNQLIAVSHSQG